jgi:hypothetical protein
MPRQPLSMAARTAAGIAGALFALAAATASAQLYAISAAGTPSGPGTCDVSTAVVPVSGGSLTTVLPPPPNNVIFTSSVNGGPTITGFSTQPSAAMPRASFAFEVQPPSLPPYTLTQSYFPAMGGAATGTGVTFTITCTASGVASLSFINNVAAPGGGSTGGGSVSAAPIPALSPPWLAALMALLAATALLGVSRRRRD